MRCPRDKDPHQSYPLGNQGQSTSTNLQHTLTWEPHLRHSHMSEGATGSPSLIRLSFKHSAHIDQTLWATALLTWCTSTAWLTCWQVKPRENNTYLLSSVKNNSYEGEHVYTRRAESSMDLAFGKKQQRTKRGKIIQLLPIYWILLRIYFSLSIMKILFKTIKATS